MQPASGRIVTMTLADLNAELLACRRCPRLVEWRERVAREKRRAYRDQEYWGKPVPGFGDPAAQVMAVGLAPGAHGSNRTGRMFTGDASGDFLYPALYRAGFASRPVSSSADDGLTLRGLYITAVCRCAPPGNKPAPEEMQNCQPYLLREIEILRPKVFVALGRIAFDALLRILDIPQPLAFAHGAVFRLESARLKTASRKDTSPSPAILNTDLLNTDHWLLASYHPSRQNTQTGRLNTAMFDEIWRKACQLLTASS
jgi:uracil-DNA glycosylase family 4